MELETKRLLLRPLCDDDAQSIAYSLNKFEVAKNLARVPYPYTLEMAQDFIGKQRSFAPPANFCAIAFRAAPDELIGIVSYESNTNNRVEFGYWLRACCWRMGIMSEAAEAMVHHAFVEDKLPNLYSGYHLDNPNSGRILRRLGFLETHEEMNFSLAQDKEVPVMKLKLAREKWQTTR